MQELTSRPCNQQSPGIWHKQSSRQTLYKCWAKHISFQLQCSNIVHCWLKTEVMWNTNCFQRDGDVWCRISTLSGSRSDKLVLSVTNWSQRFPHSLKFRKYYDLSHWPSCTKSDDRCIIQVIAHQKNWFHLRFKLFCPLRRRKSKLYATVYFILHVTGRNLDVVFKPARKPASYYIVHYS
jgi:hypothetical protein